jgi:hypothetical protein
LATLARNNGTNKMEASFYREVDAMYSSTSHAESRFGADECDRIFREATHHDQDPAELKEIVFASVRCLQSVSKGKPNRILFDLLYFLLDTHSRQGVPSLELADIHCLQELIPLCVMLCVEDATYSLGGGSVEKVEQAKAIVACAAQRAAQSVIQAMAMESA